MGCKRLTIQLNGFSKPATGAINKRQSLRGAPRRLRSQRPETRDPTGPVGPQGLRGHRAPGTQWGPAVAGLEAGGVCQGVRTEASNLTGRVAGGRERSRPRVKYEHQSWSNKLLLSEVQRRNSSHAGGVAPAEEEEREEEEEEERGGGNERKR